MVGTGPGTADLLTPAALQTLHQADVIIGYTPYLKLIEEQIEGKKVIASGMKKEAERARLAVEEAMSGKHAAVVSSGDPGVYGMAGLVLELTPPGMDVQVIPGVTAATSAAAILGAPLTHDFAVISLSDLLTPWEKICQRLAAAAVSDFVIVLYNPRSIGRPTHLQEALQIILQHRDNTTPAGYVKNIGRDKETCVVTTIDALDTEDVDMSTTVIIGNSQTKVINGRMVTPRGYEL